MVWTGGRQTKQLARAYKAEMRGAKRELRKDAAFMAEVQLKERLQRDAEYQAKIKGVYASVRTRTCPPGPVARSHMNGVCVAGARVWRDDPGREEANPQAALMHRMYSGWHPATVQTHRHAALTPAAQH
jgi:hypothetical protein